MISCWCQQRTKCPSPPPQHEDRRAAQGDQEGCRVRVAAGAAQRGGMRPLDGAPAEGSAANCLPCLPLPPRPRARAHSAPARARAHGVRRRRQAKGLDPGQSWWDYTTEERRTEGEPEPAGTIHSGGWSRLCPCPRLCGCAAPHALLHDGAPGNQVSTIIGSWVGVRRLSHLSLFLTAYRMGFPQDPSTGT